MRKPALWWGWGGRQVTQVKGKPRQDDSCRGTSAWHEDSPTERTADGNEGLLSSNMQRRWVRTERESVVNGITNCTSKTSLLSSVWYAFWKEHVFYERLSQLKKQRLFQAIAEPGSRHGAEQCLVKVSVPSHTSLCLVCACVRVRVCTFMYACTRQSEDSLWCYSLGAFHFLFEMRSFIGL